jgi:hypothetical protein
VRLPPAPKRTGRQKLAQMCKQQDRPAMWESDETRLSLMSNSILFPFHSNLQTLRPIGSRHTTLRLLPREEQRLKGVWEQSAEENFVVEKLHTKDLLNFYSSDNDKTERGLAGSCKNGN